jgi:hypothetical protein
MLRGMKARGTFGEILCSRDWARRRGGRNPAMGTGNRRTIGELINMVSRFFSNPRKKKFFPSSTHSGDRASLSKFISKVSRGDNSKVNSKIVDRLFHRRQVLRRTLVRFRSSQNTVHDWPFWHKPLVELKILCSRQTKTCSP